MLEIPYLSGYDTITAFCGIWTASTAVAKARIEKIVIFMTVMRRICIVD